MAQDLLWTYAQQRRVVDPEFSADLETALINAGFRPNHPEIEDFITEIRHEADRPCAHCGEFHDRKTATEGWYSQVRYLAGAALRAAIDRRREGNSP